MPLIGVSPEMSRLDVSKYWARDKAESEHYECVVCRRNAGIVARVGLGVKGPKPEINVAPA
jgi:hypothetical protein